MNAWRPRPGRHAAARYAPFAVIAIGAGLAWLVVALRGGTGTDVAAATAVATALALLWERRIDAHEAARNPAARPGDMPGELLEEWRVRLRQAVAAARIDEGGQLDHMVHADDTIDLQVRLVARDTRRPRLKVKGRLLPWLEVTREWDESGGRLVIVGEPGYGKTVTALKLIAHINASKDVGSAVAELFALADWHLWREHRADGTLGEWLIERLTLSYVDLPRDIARQLVSKRMVMPVLDGLDEIPTVQKRKECAGAIHAYAGKTDPHRSFVLTCSSREYAELAPDFIRAERHIMLVGVQPEQVDAFLSERTVGRAGWAPVRARHVARDRHLVELFRSPLRLAVALRVYREHDPTELLDLTTAQARRRLWTLLLANGSDGTEAFGAAAPAAIHSWLAFIAAGMKRMGRQRLMLHELYLIHPDPYAAFLRFRTMARIAIAVVVGVPAGIAAAVTEEPIAGLDVGLLLGVGAAFAATTVFGPAPSLPSREGVRGRLRRARRGPGLFWALIAGPVVGFAAGTSWGLATASFFVMLDLLLASTDIVVGDPPKRFSHMRPDAVLVASRKKGLISGSICGLLVGLVAGLLGGVAAGVASGLITALLSAIWTGLDAWLNHYWVRWELTSRGHLPRHLEDFLAWCAEPARGWLRISDAYEFRHRELLDHLASTDLAGAPE